MPSRRIRRSVVAALLLAPVAACGPGDSPSSPPLVLPLEALELDANISPATIALGDTAWVTLRVHNPLSATSITTAAPDGCPVIEPVIQFGASMLFMRPFVGTCYSGAPRGDVDPARTTLTLGPGESVELRYPFTGTAIDVLASGRCNVVGRYKVFFTPTGQEMFGRPLPARSGSAPASVTGTVEAPAGTPRCS